MQNFLVKYRLLLNVPHPDIHKKQASSVKWPIYTSVADFQANAGSKMKALVELLLHLCAHDDAAPPIVDPDNNDRMKFPDLPAVPEGESPPQRKKTLVYFNFTAITNTLVSVRLYFPICSFRKLILMVTPVGA